MTYVKDADDRSNDTAHGQQESIFYARTIFISYSAQGQSGNDSAYIRFKQIGAHTSNVAYVIAYVIGNNGRVSGIIFRNTGFNLTYQVGTYVGSLSVNAAAYTCEQGDRAGAQTKTSNNINVAVKNEISDGQTQDAQANYAQTHYGTTGKGNL